ncbi:hypothetical protein SAMN02745181_3747 [Rubritalea squalenifaciens DSM 18772]|uniref:SnoaL-like domain-containing protein n=1 Tax=Rubritalea squalenifaciens DSM 18772 TaxID=1123071 RepID=A0A1M6S827_9BACT|nr:nuclear transport factor 2 family protein [Rubritalea squalenifaciens]SHK40850.1 hypothetical protein SAMN02745181_3747 [Rubritalea squalenifaciens DSM 18772]
MKCLLVLLLFSTALLGQEDYREIEVPTLMKQLGLKTEGLSFRDDATDEITLITRGDKLVGYYRLETSWQPQKMKVPEGVTKILYGLGKGKANMVIVTEADELAIWLAAYQNHTEQMKASHAFVPTSPDAGFPLKRQEIAVDESEAYEMSLYFYRGEEEVLAMKAGLEMYEEMGANLRNPVLYALLNDQMPRPEIAPVPQNEFKKPDEYNGMPFEDNEGRIKEWFKGWVQTFNEDDPKKMMAFYDDGEDSANLDMLVSVGRWHHGREEARKAYEGDAEVLDYYDSQAVDLKVRYLGGNYALVSFQHHFKYKVKEDGRKFQVKIRTTMTLKWLNGNWKIVQEHSSPMENVPYVVEIE